jgi:hypothetical protein
MERWRLIGSVIFGAIAGAAVGAVVVMWSVILWQVVGKGRKLACYSSTRWKNVPAAIATLHLLVSIPYLTLVHPLP